MLIHMMKSKIHRATVTEANLNYEGSISIDPTLMDAAQILAWEQVDIYNCNNGERFTTYVIPGKKGQIGLNGAAARKVHPGDLVIIVTYISLDQESAAQHEPKAVFVNEKNEIKEIRKEALPG
jgi:aspartate 1-decarboxylase